MKSSLLDQYKKQWQWRDWNSLFSKLPDLKGKTILDLGCAHGDHSHELSKLGASVIGVDANPELLEYAKSRNIPNANFIQGDLTKLSSLIDSPVDGIWSSFVLAYFVDSKSIIKLWLESLNPTGWIALTEINDFLSHQPMSLADQKKITLFYQDALSRNVYDFSSGSKIEKTFKELDLEIIEQEILKDSELSGSGKSSKEVITAWSNRLERMGGLKNFFGDDFKRFKNDFLITLSDEDYFSECKSYFCLATKK